jgi:NAD(P)-dependent dehydrogenase (short-subunit alcohol dehydrogenase family)
MDLGLGGRSAVVTGGSKGIGLAIVRGLAAAGTRVTVGARTSSADLDELARTGQVQVVLADLAGPAGPASLIGQAGDRIDVLVNNVGGAPARTGGFLSITDADWHATIELDLMAAVRATRAALPTMLAAGTGVIVTTCSVNARLPDPAVLDYSVAKAGLASFCKALSKEVGPAASASTPSAPARWPPTCGSAGAGWPRPWARRPVLRRRRWQTGPPARWQRAGSPVPAR